MSIRCSVYIATSVDGFIAKPDGDIDWLHNPDYAASPMRGLSYDDFIATVDTIVLGRHSFEKVLTFGGWSYEGTPVVVLSSKGVDVPEELAGKVRVMSGSPEEVVSVLESQGKQHLYVDGGNTIQRFLRVDLINEITITRIPVLLGDGISMFGAFGAEVPLRLIEATASDNGFVQVRYEVRPGA